MYRTAVVRLAPIGFCHKWNRVYGPVVEEQSPTSSDADYARNKHEHKSIHAKEYLANREKAKRKLPLLDSCDLEKSFCNYRLGNLK